jgi:hypothetical protein
LGSAREAKNNPGKDPHQCLVHGSKFEGKVFSPAFCNKLKTLLCINCILEDKTKQFELSSLEDAFLKESGQLETSRLRLEDEQNNLAELESQIKEHMNSVKDGLEEKQQAVQLFFNDLRKTIDSREKELLEDYEENFQKEMARAKSYASLVSQKRAGLGDSLHIIKEICNIKDKVIILSQAKEVNNLIEISFKSVKPEKLQYNFKEFKPDQEIKTLLKSQQLSETKPGVTSKSRTPKYSKENCQTREIETVSEEIPKSLLKPSPDSPKPSNSIGVVSYQDGLASNNLNTKGKQSIMAASGANHSGMSRSLITRDKNKVTEPSRDKSSRKDTKAVTNLVKEKKKENMPPKVAHQPQVQAVPVPPNKASGKNIKKYSSKLEDPKLKPINMALQNKKELTEEELGKISLTTSLNDEKGEYDIIAQNVHINEPNVSKLYGVSEANHSQPSMGRKISDLDKARALKKAATKTPGALPSDKMSTPTKTDKNREQIHIGSWSKSMNKKAVVDYDHSNLSENQSIRLTDLKPTLLPETETPTFMILGKKFVT